MMNEQEQYEANVKAAREAVFAGQGTKEQASLVIVDNLRQTLKDIEEELAEVQAENDRFRAALEEVADFPRGVFIGDAKMHLQQIARVALQEAYPTASLVETMDALRKLVGKYYDNVSPTGVTHDETPVTNQSPPVGDEIHVLAIRHEQLGTMYLDTLKGIEEQLEVFFGENEEWHDYVGDKLTITIETMKKSDFDALEPFEP
jgi:hypothetical protein